MLRRLMSTPILPVEGLGAAEGSSAEIGGVNQTTRTRQRELGSANQTIRVKAVHRYWCTAFTHRSISVPSVGQQLGVV